MATSPMFWSIEAFVAWVVLQFKVDDCPSSIAEGSAESLTSGSGAGAVAGGDGAGGAMGALFLQPAIGTNVKNTKVSKTRCEMSLFINDGLGSLSDAGKRLILHSCLFFIFWMIYSWASAG